MSFNETALIGSLLRDNTLIDTIDYIQPKHFTLPDMAKIYSYIRKKVAEGKSAESIIAASDLDIDYSVALSLEKQGQNDHIKDYADAVTRDYELKQLQTVAQEVIDRAKSGDAAILTDVHMLLENLTQVQHSKSNAKDMKSLASDWIDDIQRRAEQDSGLNGLSTGYSNLDEKLNGLGEGDLIIIAGRPAMGKTTLAMNIADNIAENGGSILVFSLEMGDHQLMDRLVARRSRVSLDKILTANLTPDDWAKVTPATTTLAERNIIVDDSPGLNVGQVMSRARRVKRNHDLDLIVIDYLQLMQLGGDNLVNEIGKLTRGLKLLAKELKVPVILISQLNREVDKREHKIPVMSDLRDSGAIEQDADKILFVYRPAPYATNEADKIKLERDASVIIGKNRQGKAGMVRMLFVGEHNAFHQLSPENMEF
jgi:replicative DNA helicase